MKILITGGAGFIGSNLTDKLVELGHDCFVLDDLSTGKKEYLNSKAKFFEADIRDKEKVQEIFKEKFGFVFHLAAQIDVRKSVEDPVFDNDVNVAGSLNILEAAKETRVKKIIFSSTGGALYGDADQIPTSESYPCWPISPYGIHKLCFEKHLNYYYRIFGQKYTALRFSNVYGPRQYRGGEAGVVSIFIDNHINGKESLINGDGSQTRDYIYVGDIVCAFLAAMNSDFVGSVNIGTGKELDLNEVIRLIEEASGKKFNYKKAPAKAGEQMRSCLDNTLAKEVLNWQPEVELLEGVRKTMGIG